MTDKTLCSLLKKIYFYGYVCVLKQEKKSFVPNENKNQKLTFMRFFTSFPNQKRRKEKSGWEKAKLKNIS